MSDEIKAFTDTTTDVSDSENKQRDDVNIHSRKAITRRESGLQEYLPIIVAEHEVPVMKDGLPTGKTRMKKSLSWLCLC